MEDPSAADRRAAAQADPGGTGLRRGLVALATAAVVSVYAAGYVRTEAAAERLQGGEGGRRGTPESSPQAEQHPPTSTGPVTTVAAGIEPTSAAPAPGAAQGASTGSAGAPVPATPPAPAAPGDPGPAVAAAAAPAAALAESPAPAEAPASEGVPYRDGVYTGWGNSPHGRIEATVEVREGRILTATISNCRMRWPCARIAYLVPQVSERQSAEVDVISRVTDSSDAFYYALVEALSKAK